MKIPFNKPFMAGKELEYISQAYAFNKLSGDGTFSKKCQSWLEEKIGCAKALLTHSGTAALEMSALLIDIKPGDEVIMPSFTFVSTANAFVLRGGIPVFVDIRQDTLNIDESKIEAAITPKTKAIVVVHYAGISCEMDNILEIAKKHQLYLIEDAAQGVMSFYKDKPLGSFGHLATFSFHETKNLISGEGGALLINTPELIERAEIIREKGTNRSQFFRDEIDKYTWVDVGSSFLPSEISAAFLWAQMEEVMSITQNRIATWNTYHSAFHELEMQNKIRRPIVPANCRHNGHIYYFIFPTLQHRSQFIKQLNGKGINTVFHYVPLHSSPAGKKFGYAHGDLSITEDLSNRIVRLPLWKGIEEFLNDNVIENIRTAC